MKYNKFDEVPVEIQEFFYEEVVSEPTGTFNESEPDEEGNTYKIPVMHDVTYLREHVRGETKVMRDLDRLIALNKPMSVLVRFSEIICETIRWQWLDEFNEYLEDCDRINDINSAIEIDDEGLPLSDALTLPTAPDRTKVPTSDQILAPYQRSLFKSIREAQVKSISVQVDELIFDGDEESQGRMARAILSMTAS